MELIRQSERNGTGLKKEEMQRDVKMSGELVMMKRIEMVLERVMKMRRERIITMLADLMMEMKMVS